MIEDQFFGGNGVSLFSPEDPESLVPDPDQRVWYQNQTRESGTRLCVCVRAKLHVVAQQGAGLTEERQPINRSRPPPANIQSQPQEAMWARCLAQGHSDRLGWSGTGTSNPSVGTRSENSPRATSSPSGCPESE